jgi:hypothetical protein
MKKKLLVGLAFGMMVAGMTGTASATFIISDVSLTSNSVTFTIDGDMTGYSEPSYQPFEFNLQYSGDIFVSDGGYAPNTWSGSVFDNATISSQGNTGTWYATDYTWSHYLDSLANAVSTNKTVTLTTTKNYFDLSETGSIAFTWGHPLSSNTLIANVDIVNGHGGTAPVPEPATMLLMGTGIAGLIAARRRKKA